MNLLTPLIIGGISLYFLTQKKSNSVKKIIPEKIEFAIALPHHTVLQYPAFVLAEQNLMQERKVIVCVGKAGR